MCLKGEEEEGTGVRRKRSERGEGREGRRVKRQQKEECEERGSAKGEE